MSSATIETSLTHRIHAYRKPNTSSCFVELIQFDAIRDNSKFKLFHQTTFALGAVYIAYIFALF
jgi:hypothetical protein